MVFEDTACQNTGCAAGVTGSVGDMEREEEQDQDSHSITKWQSFADCHFCTTSSTKAFAKTGKFRFCNTNKFILRNGASKQGRKNHFKHILNVTGTSCSLLDLNPYHDDI